MVNELVPVELYGSLSNGAPRRFAVADGTKITKGSLLKLIDPRTASFADVYAAPFAGIASMDKEADDGATSISCWEDGVFEATASGTIAVGSLVAMEPANKVSSFPSSGSYSWIVGTALETAADLERINIRVNN